MNEELMECDTLAEMFAVLKRFYNLEDCKPSMMLKMVVIPQLVEAVERLEPEPKKSGSAVADMKNKGSVNDILKTLSDYYDLDSVSLSPIQKQKMCSKIPAVAQSLGARLR